MRALEKAGDLPASGPERIEALHKADVLYAVTGVVETIKLVPEFSPAVLAAIDIDGEMPRVPLHLDADNSTDSGALE